MTEHMYWTFVCKTPYCQKQTAFMYIGIYQKGKTPFFVTPTHESFNLKCPSCEQTHKYAESEIIPEISDHEPSTDFPRYGTS
jgi:hypothetical protein